MNTEAQTHSLSKVDRVGACVSLACAIHCMLLPFVVTVLPFIGLGFLAHHDFELAMIIIAVGLATFSLCWGSRIHKNHRLLYLVLAALLLFLIKHLGVDGVSGAILAGMGGLCLVTGHFLNRKLCATCTECSCH